MQKIISILLGIFIFIKGIFWVKMGKTGVKTDYILGDNCYCSRKFDVRFNNDFFLINMEL